MKLRGGYNLKLQGMPGGSILSAPLPETLYYPLKTRSFHYSEICVKHGQQVATGEVLARDPECYDVPLLSSCGGTVDLEAAAGHVTLTQTSVEDLKEYSYQEDPEHVHEKMGPGGFKRYKMLNLGAWECVEDVYTGQMPDPLSTPEAIIVSTLRLQPLLIRGDVLLNEYMRQFTRGLEHLQSLLEYQPIYLVLPKIKTDLALRIKEQIRGYAWVKVVEVPLQYPHGRLSLLASHLGFKRAGGNVWGMHVEGVLAIDQVLTTSRPYLERFISVAGPGAAEPVNLKVTPGHPVSDIIKDYAKDGSLAVIDGILTGSVLSDDVKGLPADCKGITLLSEHQQREFLGFVRPGFDRQSYSACYLSALCGPFSEAKTNAVSGEVRPCVSCNFCGEVCPAGIIPHRLHKLVYQDDIDRIEQSRIDLCIECGLCSYVCPSKIELMHEFKQAKQTLLEEKAAAAAEAAAKAEAEEQNKDSE